MPENPIYDSKKVVKKVSVPDYNVSIADSNTPVYNPNKVLKKEVIDNIEYTKDSNVIMPTPKTTKDYEIEKTLDFVQENSNRNMRDDEKEILKSMMYNPNTTQEELSDAIVTLQGKKAKQIENTILQPDYYLKKDEVSGNYRPVALTQYEKPPAGYDTPSIWGNQKSANDDKWYTDLSKSIVNGVAGLVGGVIDLAQTGTTLATGEESKYLTGAKQATEYLKFKKDEDLNKSIYNTEGIETFADLADKNRFDLSPQALWGATNMLAESLTEFGLGTLTGGNIAKAGKAFNYGKKGIDTALELGSKGQKFALFTGGYISQLGDNLDAAEEAGLQGRDKAAVASLITMPMAALDAFWGLDGKLMSNLFNKTKKETLKNLISTVEKDAAGNITERGFKELAKQTSVQYGELAKNGAKEIVKDMASEGGQEAAQDFVQKAGENLWDKMTEDERGQYGTNALSARSFGEYINSFVTGGISGGPMSLVSTNLKNKNEQQSINAYERVKEGPKAVEALKTDLQNALQKGEITESEHEQALFKIDAYDKYHTETKDYNMKPDAEKRAFELSFQIEGLKTEIPTNENEISKLGPIERAKVEGKQQQAKDLQKELNEIVLGSQIKQEPLVAKKTEEKIDKIENPVEKKPTEKTKKKEESNSDLNQKPVFEDLVKSAVSEKELDAILDQADVAGLSTPELLTTISKKRDRLIAKKESGVNDNYEEEKQLPKQPEWDKDKRGYEEVSNEEFNNSKFNPRTKHRMLRSFLNKKENKEVGGVLSKRKFKYWDSSKQDWVKNSVIEVELEDGRKIGIASSQYREEGFRGHLRSEILLGNKNGVPVGVKVIDLNNPTGELKEGDFKPGKKVIKVYNKRDGKFLSWAKETKTGNVNAKDKLGNALYSDTEIEMLKDLETKVEASASDSEIENIVKPKTPKEPTGKVVEESKSKADSARLTNQVSKKENVDTADKKASEKQKLTKNKEVETTKKTENGKQESATNGEGIVNRNVEKTDGENGKPNKPTKKLGGIKAILRKPKHPKRLEAGKIEPTSVYYDVMKYFIDGGRVSKESIRELYKNSKGEVMAKNNITYSEKKYDKKYAPNLDQLADKLWNNSPETFGDVTTENYKDAIELVLQKYNSPVVMAEDYITALSERERVTPSEEEQVVMAAYDKINEELGYKLDIAIDFLEGKSKEELEALAEKDKWETGTDIIINEESEPFQKSNVKEEELNDDYLKEIEKQAKKIKDGKEIYKRYSQTEIGGLTESGIRGIEATIISGRNVSRDENQDDRVERQEKDLEVYARGLNIWYDNTEDYLKEKYGDPMDSGQESLVFRKNSKRLIKTSITNQYLDLQDFFDGVVVHNAYFPESSVEVVGFGKDSEGEFNIITEQDYINGTHDISQEQINEYMESIGFVNVNSRGRFKNNDVLINDVVPRNVMVMPKGEIIPFDTIAHLNTKSQPMNESGTRMNIHADHLKDIQKVIDVIKKSIPKIEVIIDDSLKDIAGKVGKNGNIYINPNYAGFDTPIHEAGHVLIDAIGYDNKVIQQAIKQLRNTTLYTETKERYPELSESELDKEVLAEAIGREGAGIFDTVADRSKFKNYLDYIFDWFKRNIGLDKNIAKSLAKQIISGIGTKNLTSTNTGKEQLSKKSSINKENVESEQGKKEKDYTKVKALNLNQYLAANLINVEKDTANRTAATKAKNEAQEELDDAEDFGTDEEIEAATAKLKKAKQASVKAFKNYNKWKKYKTDFEEVLKIVDSKDLEDYTIDDLTDAYNKIKGLEEKSAENLKQEVLLRIAYHLHRKGKDRILKEHSGYIESIADKKDIGKIQTWLLHGSHFTEYQPEMQEFYKLVQNAQINAISERNLKKDTLEKLAKKVISEENKRLGIVGASHTRFSSNSVKYFDWMDNNGKLLTVEEAQKLGLSEAKLNFLKFNREVLAERKGLMTENDYANADLDVIRVDKRFGEAYKSEGLLRAFSYYLGGGGSNIGQVRIMYKGVPTSFKDIENDIISKTKKNDVVGNTKALIDLLYYNYMARKQLKRGFNVDEAKNPLIIKSDAEYSLNANGELVSKFDRFRDENRGYSKDFYRAMIEFIDETTHVKHMNPIIPMVEAVETLNRDGYMDKGIEIKPNVAKWIEEFKALQIFNEPKVNDPALDATIKGLRKLVASSTMWFNVPANAINVVVGNYNSFRQENLKTLLTGNKRLFGGKGKRADVGIVNQYALDIIKKYSIVNQDFDSNPTLRANNIFSKIATIGTTIGEYQIQGSLALGLMDEADFNSFEYTKDKFGNDVLTVKKDADEQAIKDRMIAIKNRVTDIQGKYPAEDRRNIMRGEIAKAVFQFKVWMPDWFRERFAPTYIDANNKVRQGTLSTFYGDGLKQLKKEINEKGYTKAFWENKSVMSNLKGIATIGFLLSLKYQNDDDDNKRNKASLFDNLLGQILFILDFEQDKYMVSNPVAVLGKTKDLISAFEALIGFEEDAWKKTKRVLPAGKLINKVEEVIE